MIKYNFQNRNPKKLSHLCRVPLKILSSEMDVVSFDRSPLKREARSYFSKIFPSPILSGPFKVFERLLVHK